MSIPAIEPSGFMPFVAPSLGGVQAAPLGTDPVAAAEGAASAGARGADFGQLLANGIEQLQSLHDRTDQLAVQAATGDLNALHDYTITATEAAVSTQLTTAVRNKALEAFQEIMRMSV